jgi:hypothetical protein
MILDDISNLVDGSHKIVNVECDYKVSDKCRLLIRNSYRDVLRYRKNNSGNDVCLPCSRKSKQSGDLNPNKRYIFDNSLFKTLDTEEKCYLLGWIASDGCVSKGRVTLEIHKNDLCILEIIKEKILKCNDLPISERKNRDTIAISISSNEIVDDICSLLKISTGNKAKIVRFPDILKEKKGFGLCFIRGLFDGDGHVSKAYSNRHLMCKISSSSEGIKQDIVDFLNPFGLRTHISIEDISWSSRRSILFLDLIYGESNIHLDRKYNEYIKWKEIYDNK